MLGDDEPLDRSSILARHSNTNTKDQGKGPIPEGRYTADPKNVSHVTGLRYVLRQFRGDWGHYRVPLTPDSTTETFGRSGFFLHGGSNPGSAGCIDVGRNEDEVFKWVTGASGVVDVRAVYPPNYVIHASEVKF